MGKSETEKPKTPVKTKKEKPLYPTKVVIRRLPPTLTEDRFKEELGEIPPYDFFYFVGSNMSFSPVPFSRAYINFKNPGDIVKFKDQFDGYLFVGERGVEHPAVVEYAPYQGVPRKRKHKDTKCGTIAKDPDYLAFLESLKEKAEPLPSIEVHLEEIEAKKLEKDGSKFPKTTTPLLEYLKMKRNSRNSSRPSPRISPEKKKRSEKDEPPKSLKKGFSQSSASSSSKITNSDSSRSDKYKDQKKTEKKGSRGKDESHGREKQEKRGGKDTKTRPDSARGGRHYDDREDVPDRGSHRGSSRGSGRRDRSRQNHEDDDWPKGKSDTRKKTSEESPTAKGSGKPERVERGTSAAKEMETDIKEEKQGKVDAGKRKSSEEKGSRETSEGKRSEREHDARPTDRSKNMRNKDRPDRAIYQPRSRSGKSSEYPDKEKSKDTKPTSDKKENRRSSDAERSQAKQAHDERERRDRDRERNRDRDRERGSRRDRDRDRDYKDRSERERKGDRPYERDRGKRHDPDKGRSKETMKEAGGEKREAEKKQVVKSGDHTVAQDDANQ